MQVFRYESVESTNETAKRLIQQPGFAGPAYVVAREQTAGKGTRGRTWASPKDAGVYISVIEMPEPFFLSSSSKSNELTAFTLAAGVACVERLRQALGLCVSLKPINDLYVDGCKLGGILTEAIIESGQIAALITGIGINVRRAEREIADAKFTPISLEELLEPAADLNIDVLAGMLAADVHALNRSVLRGDAEKVRWAWEQYRVAEAESAQ